MCPWVVSHVHMASSPVAQSPLFLSSHAATHRNNASPHVSQVLAHGDSKSSASVGEMLDVCEPQSASYGYPETPILSFCGNTFYWDFFFVPYTWSHSLLLALIPDRGLRTDNAVHERDLFLFIGSKHDTWSLSITVLYLELNKRELMNRNINRDKQPDSYYTVTPTQASGGM